MYYDSIQNDIGAERAFLEANRLNIATPSSIELAEPADMSGEVDGAASDPGAEEPVGESGPGTSASEATKLPEVHGKLDSRERGTLNKVLYREAPRIKTNSVHKPPQECYW